MKEQLGIVRVNKVIQCLSWVSGQLSVVSFQDASDQVGCWLSVEGRRPKMIESSALAMAGRGTGTCTSNMMQQSRRAAEQEKAGANPEVRSLPSWA